jgi:hypothetical protein
MTGAGTLAYGGEEGTEHERVMKKHGTADPVLLSTDSFSGRCSFDWCGMVGQAAVYQPDCSP